VGERGQRPRIITFRKTKSGKVRHVPINPDLYAVLRTLEQPGGPAAPIFPPAWNGRRVTTAFRRVANEAASGVPLP
jgi:integrase